MKRLLLSVLLGFAVTLSVCVYAQNTQGAIAQNVIRLHVIANSDSDADQAVKLTVRDKILNAFSGCELSDTSTQAANEIRNKLAAAEEIANQVLTENGFGYTAHAQFSTFDFPTKVYGNVALPAGKYRGLRIVLGEGKGQNWWCVMYPPLCFNEINTGICKQADLARALPNEAYEIVTAQNSDNIEFEVKFKIVELWERFKHSLE